MKRTPILVILSLAISTLGIFSSCGGGGDSESTSNATTAMADDKTQADAENQPAQPRRYELKNRIVVIFDASKSISPESFERASRAIQSIANKMGNKSQLLVFTTNSSALQTPLVNRVKKVPINSRERRTYEETWKQEVSKVIQKIKNAISEKEEITCLISAIKSVKNYLNGAMPAENTYLVFISDMLECCDGICIEKKSRIPTAQIRLQKLDLTYYQLADLIPASNLYGYQLSEKLDEQLLKTIDTEEFRQFWKMVFEKLGYQQAPAFTTSLDGFLAKI